MVSGEDYYRLRPEAHLQTRRNERHRLACRGPSGSRARIARLYEEGWPGSPTMRIPCLTRARRRAAAIPMRPNLVRFGHRAAGPEELAELEGDGRPPATSPQRPDGWYGLRLLDRRAAGRARNWGHGGGAPGMNAAFRVFPELDAIVVALANLDPLAADSQATFMPTGSALVRIGRSVRSSPAQLSAT